MTWAQIDDGFADHPKHADLSNDATATWVRLLAYCSRYLTDGAVPRSVATRSARVPEQIAAERVLAELCAAGLLDDRGDTYHVHDYLQWNRSRATVLAEREATKNRKNAWAAKRNAVRNASGTEEERRSERVKNASGTVFGTLPSPLLSTRSKDPEIPPCIPPSEEEPPAAPSQPEGAQPAKRKAPTQTTGLPPDAEVPAWLEALGVPALDDPTHGADVAAWIDYHRARATRFASWPAAWRTWARNAQRFARGAPAHRPLVQRQQGMVQQPIDAVTGLPWTD